MWEFEYYKATIVISDHLVIYKSANLEIFDLEDVWGAGQFLIGDDLADRDGETTVLILSGDPLDRK